MRGPRFWCWFRLARQSWWLAEWLEAIGNACEDQATVAEGYRRTPRWYRLDRQAGGDGNGPLGAHEKAQNSQGPSA